MSHHLNTVSHTAALRDTACSMAVYPVILFTIPMRVGVFKTPVHSSTAILLAHPLIEVNQHPNRLALQFELRG